MADLSFKPVGADVTVPKINLSEMIGTMRGLQEYKKSKEVNPLVIRQQQAVTQQQEMQNKADQAAKLIDAQSALINHPLVVRAAQNPASVSANELTGLINQYGELGRTITGVPKERVAEITGPLLDIIKTNPAQLQQRLRNDYLATVDRTARAGLLQPTMKDITGFAPTGEKVTQGVNINPFAGPVGQPVGPSSFAGPGMDMQLTGETDPNTGLPIAAVRDARTGAIRRVTVPGGMFGTPPTFGGGAPAGQMPGAGPGVMNQPLPPGAGAAGRVPVGPPPPVPEYGAPGVYTPPTAAGGAGGIEASQTLFNQTRQAAASAPMERQNSNKIIQLADKSLTGSAAGTLAALGGGLAAVPWTADEVSNRQELGHYLSQQTAQLAASAGLAGTDAARHIAGEMAGDITWTAPAIKKTARTNRALTAANEMLYQGMTMAAQANPQDREIANKYRDAWVKQLGVNGVDAIRLSDAYNNRDLDPDGVNEIVKELGGVKSKRFAQVMKKAEELNRLMGQ